MKDLKITKEKVSFSKESKRFDVNYKDVTEIFNCSDHITITKTSYGNGNLMRESVVHIPSEVFDIIANFRNKK